MTDEQMTGLCLKYENADDDFWEEYTKLSAAEQVELQAFYLKWVETRTANYCIARQGDCAR